MSAGGETPRADEPGNNLERALDAALEALDVTLRQRRLALRSAILVIRLDEPVDDTGRDGGFAGRVNAPLDDLETELELEELLERGLRSVRRTRPPL